MSINKVILVGNLGADPDIRRTNSDLPVCGFSARAVQVLDHYGVPYASVNILEHPEIRSTLPKLMNWPTFPQLYVNGELIGGSDILMEMHEAGELESVLNKK